MLNLVNLPTVTDETLRSHFMAQYQSLTGQAMADHDLPLGKVLDAMEVVVHLNDANVVGIGSLTPASHPIAAENAASWPAGEAEKAHKSTTERPCQRVFTIAGDMIKANPDVRRKDVIAACVEAGIAFYTARTQYQQWLTAHKEEVAREAKASV